MNPLLKLAYDSPAAWFPAFGKILTKEQTLTHVGDGASSYQQTRYQIKLLEAYEYCVANKLPCRILGLKGRQDGSSTICSAILYHHIRRNKATAVQMADRYKNSANLFQIVNRYAENDVFPWPNQWKALEDTATITTPDGQPWSKLVKDTAENPRAGRSGTFQVMHVSEAAHFPTDGVKSGDKTLLALLNALADGPNSLGIVETTANGTSGWFYRQWFGDSTIGLAPAVTLEEFKQGKIGNGWIKVFGPWFEGFDARMPVSENQKQDILSTLTEREQRGIDLYGWDVNQIARRRWLISSKCGGRESSLDQEYPEDERTAFLTSGRPRFSMAGVTRVRQMLGIGPMNCNIHLHGDAPEQTVTVEPNNNGWCQIWEQPREGCRYLVWCDTSTGAENTRGSNDPDRHSVLVLRHGYMENGDTPRNHAVVARIRPPCNVTWAALEAYVAALSIHYGRAMIGVEVPMGLTLIEGLRKLNLPLWKRRDPTKPLAEGKLGFSTNSATKPQIIEALSRALDEPSLDLYCPHIVSELEAFVVHEDGREAALRGQHDDDVTALAMAVFCIGSATVMKQHTVYRQGPKDRHLWRAPSTTISGKPSVRKWV